jgi:NAD-dependent protein deacetylase/lipoamidase
MLSEKFLMRLKHASGITVLTGAGISAESGVPTFRGKDGLWENHKVEELATVEAFQNDPIQFWKFYNWRRNLLKDVKPNLGHYALVDFERIYPEFHLITQNVDGLHTIAGNNKLVELHGNIMRDKCSDCGDVNSEINMELSEPPTCTKCGKLMRPDVVLFGENLSRKDISNAQEMSATCELFISIGTSSLVEPAASLPYAAKGNGAYLVEINPEDTPLTQFVDEQLKGTSSKILAQLAVILDKIR